MYNYNMQLYKYAFMEKEGRHNSELINEEAYLDELRHLYLKSDNPNSKEEASIQFKCLNAGIEIEKVAAAAFGSMFEKMMREDPESMFDGMMMATNQPEGIGMMKEYLKDSKKIAKLAKSIGKMAKQTNNP